MNKTEAKKELDNNVEIGFMVLTVAPFDIEQYCDDSVKEIFNSLTDAGKTLFLSKLSTKMQGQFEAQGMCFECMRDAIAELKTTPEWDELVEAAKNAKAEEKKAEDDSSLYIVSHTYTGMGGDATMDIEGVFLDYDKAVKCVCDNAEDEDEDDDDDDDDEDYEGDEDEFETDDDDDCPDDDEDDEDDDDEDYDEEDDDVDEDIAACFSNDVEEGSLGTYSSDSMYTVDQWEITKYPNPAKKK